MGKGRRIPRTLTPSLRKKCLERDHNKCRVTGSGINLVIHHIDGHHTHNWLENLITLTKDVHIRLHRMASWNLGYTARQVELMRLLNQWLLMGRADDEEERGERDVSEMSEEQERL